MHETRWRDDALLYHYGELAPAPSRDFEAHLRACAECAGTLADLRAVEGAARASGLSAKDFPLASKRRMLWEFVVPSAALAGATLGLMLLGMGTARRAAVPPAQETVFETALDHGFDALAADIGALARDLEMEDL